MSESTISIFKTFLLDKSIVPKSLVSLETMIEENFSQFNESLLRDLIERAIRSRNMNKEKGLSDANLLGPWGEIIDAVKVVLSTRQTSAATNFQMVLDFGRRGDKRSVTGTLARLHQSGHIDYLFREILSDTKLKCQEDGHTDFVDMLQFFDDVITRIDNISIAKRVQQLEQQRQHGQREQRDHQELPHERVQSSNDAEANDTPTVSLLPETSPMSASVAAATATILMVPTRSHPDADSDNEDEYDEKDALTDSDDEVDATSAQQASNEAHFSELQLIQTNDFLQNAIKSSQGDAKHLKLLFLDACRSGSVDTAHLFKVLDDNIDAAVVANYAVKVKLLNFIKNFLNEEVNGAASFSSEQAYAAIDGNATSSSTVSATTTHHAPQFVDSIPANAQELEVILPDSFLDGTLCRPLVCPDTTKINKKKKQVKRLARQQYSDVAEHLAQHYEQHGWAVCDNFLPIELVRRIRLEAGLFTTDYEQSEIWVGKQADVGAHLVVPSVRGDKVLWMCGHHNSAAAPEGITRAIKTHGEIEPCRLDVKAKAPLRKFHALKDVVAAMNNMVEALKPYAPSLAGIYERSDCMLAVYPGNGSRFARHIDNTTNDGRRLTMLVYLNPAWDSALGGCLRLTPPGLSHAVDVLPVCGRMAIFSSAMMPHEVMPTFGDRHSLTVWYYDSVEREAAISKARLAGHAEEVSKSSVEAQREAKSFIAELMGGDEVQADGGDPSPEDLRLLADRVKGLSSDALRIVSSITGAPSEESFREGFELLLPNDLKSMRQLFRRMGLQQ